MRLLHLSEAHRAPWDRLVGKTAESGFMQSWGWSRFKESQGQRVLRLGIEEEDELIAGALVYYVNTSFGASPLEIPHGPVLPWKEQGRVAQAASLLHKELSTFASRTGAAILRIEPLISGQIPHWPAPLVRSPLDLAPTPTLLIDLSPGEEAILASMKPKGRYNIRLALRKGVEVSWSSHPAAVDDFYFLFELTCRRHDFAGEPKEFFADLLRIPEPMLRVYFASFRGMTLASAIVIFFADCATFLYGGSLPFFRTVMAPYAMHWQIMRDAKALGCRSYDFFGIAPRDDSAHGYGRFSQFKSRFGGSIVTTAGAHDEYFYSQLAALWIEKMAKVHEIQEIHELDEAHEG